MIGVAFSMLGVAGCGGDVAGDGVWLVYSDAG